MASFLPLKGRGDTLINEAYLLSHWCEVKACLIQMEGMSKDDEALYLGSLKDGTLRNLVADLVVSDIPDSFESSIHASYSGLLVH